MMEKNKGSTLIEFQVTVLIATIILLAALSLYISLWRYFGIGNTYLDVYLNSRLAVERLARDIRWTAQVMPSYGSYATSDNSVVLKIPSIDSSGNVIAGHYDYASYSLQGSDLKRVVQVDSLSSRQNEDRTVARYCSSLVFSTRDSGGNVLTLSNVSNLSTVNNIAIFLPLNKTMTALSGTGTEAAGLTPTTIVKLRNK